MAGPVEGAPLHSVGWEQPGGHPPLPPPVSLLRGVLRASCTSVP